MKAKMRIFSILFALVTSAGIARADSLTTQITGPSGSATLTNGGSGPAFGLVNTTGIFGVAGSNLSAGGVAIMLYSTGVIQLTNTSNVAETIDILSTDTNFVAPGPGSLATTLAVSNLASATDSVSSFSGIEGAGGTTTSPITVNGPSGSAISPAASFDVSGTTTLFNDTTVTLAAGSQATFTVTSQVAAVPEPSSLLLAGSCLVGFFGLRRRRA